jgi:HPt (histidine-containing phosphotransfer) domain-containing protein
VDEPTSDLDFIVDWEAFSRTRTELGAGFVRILGYFREDGEKSVSKIEDAMQRGDAAALVIPAHTMKSEARQFGAEPLGALAEEIEIGARRAVEMRVPPDDLIPQAARLRPLYEKTMELFERETNPLQQRRPAAGFGRAGGAS